MKIIILWLLMIMFKLIKRIKLKILIRMKNNNINFIFNKEENINKSSAAEREIITIKNQKKVTSQIINHYWKLLILFFEYLIFGNGKYIIK